MFPVTAYGQLTDDAKMGGDNHREGLSHNAGAVAWQICKEPGGAHCHMHHVTMAGVTHDRMCRSHIRDNGWWGRWWVRWQDGWWNMMNGQREGNSWVTKSGEGTQRMAQWVWHMCSGVLSNHNRLQWTDQIVFPSTILGGWSVNPGSWSLTFEGILSSSHMDWAFCVNAQWISWTYITCRAVIVNNSTKGVALWY